MTTSTLLPPAFIHTFVDLCGIWAGTSITKDKILAGMYALVYSYSALEPDAIKVPNEMKGRYTLDREGSSHVPKLFLINVEAIAGLIRCGWQQRS